MQYYMEDVQSLRKAFEHVEHLVKRSSYLPFECRSGCHKNHKTHHRQSSDASTCTECELGALQLATVLHLTAQRTADSLPTHLVGGSSEMLASKSRADRLLTSRLKRMF